MASYGGTGGTAQDGTSGQLPTGMGPKGIVSVPSRDLLIVTSETDAPHNGIRTVVSIYKRTRGDVSYLQVVSDGGSRRHADPVERALGPGRRSPPGLDALRRVGLGLHHRPRILTLDVGETPAVVTASQPVTGGTGGYDFEGIALAPDGTRWLASEGNASDSVPNRLLQVNRSGNVVAEIGLPADVLACRRASTNRGTLGSGFEGVAVQATGGGRYVLRVAQQRGWDYTTPECEALDDDPTGANAGEPVRPGVEPRALPARAGPAPGGVGGAVGDRAAGRRQVRLHRARQPCGSTLSRPVTRDAKRRLDVLPPLRASAGWISDKPEGFTVAKDGRAHVVTDNDAVDDAPGETQLLRLGDARRLFR